MYLSNWNVGKSNLKALSNINLTYYTITVEPLKTVTSVNRNSLETEQLARSQFFTLYFHCIKIPVNQNPLYSGYRTSFLLFPNDFNTILPLKTEQHFYHLNCFDNTRLCLPHRFLAGKHDQKTWPADFSLQSVVKHSTVI